MNLWQNTSYKPMIDNKKSTSQSISHIAGTFLIEGEQDCFSMEQVLDQGKIGIIL